MTCLVIRGEFTSHDSEDDTPSSIKAVGWDHLAWVDDTAEPWRVYECIHYRRISETERAGLQSALTEILNYLEMARNPPRDVGEIE